MMQRLLHCGKRRVPSRRVDIRPPSEMMRLQAQDVNLKEVFELISVYEFFCPNCLRMNGQPWHYAWIGHYYNSRLGKSPLLKIAPKQLSKWLDWISDRKIMHSARAVDSVRGSQDVFPYRLVNRPV